MANDGPSRKLAFSIAKLLNASNQSPFYKQIRFDSKGMAPLPISTLCPKGASDLGTSLVGLARVGLATEAFHQPEWLAFCIVAIVKTLQDEAPDLLAEGKVLTSPPNGDKRTATMLVGLGVALAYRMALLGEEIPSDRTKACLAAAAQRTLDRDEQDIYSAPSRRKLMGAFTRDFFADLTDLNKLDGIPEGLLAILSSSAYGPPNGVARVEHGQRGPSLKDRKQEAVILLQDPEVSVWSDRELGRRCGLDGKTIKALRQKLFKGVPKVRKVNRKGGSYYIDVSQIGKR